MSDGTSNGHESLADRHRREQTHHDRSHAVGDGCSFVYSMHPTYQIFQDLVTQLAPQPGEKVLECGCGSGWSTVELAKFPIVLSAFDISSEAVTQAKARLDGKPRRARYEVKQMVAERLEFPNAHFDAVAGFAILHHLDLGIALPEIARVLKPGGRALFAEPLGSNPAINLYRRRTPEYRTPDERPLVLRDFVKQAESWFVVTHRPYYLTALAPLALGAILSPGVVKLLMAPAVKLDRLIFRALPWTRQYAWYTLLTLRSKILPGT